MASQLSPYRLRKARDIYNYFNVFNAVSWNLLVGIIITLFALRLGASATYIGLLSSSFYIALFLLPLGKILARRFSIIGVFSFTWTVRSICMVLAVAAPFFEYAGKRNTALFLVMIGVFLFHLFRGVGMIGNNPVLSTLASGPDRGSYMTQIQIINSAIGMFGSFLIAMVLGMEPPIFIFSILLSLGVISGVISGQVIRKVPEPQIERDSRRVPLHEIFKDAFSQDSLRHFMYILFLVVLVSGVTRTFVIVYAREAFGHNDGLISLYSVFGGLGYLMAGLSVTCLIPSIFLPVSFVDNMTGSILFFVFLFFMLNFGFLGSEGIAQTYYLALVPPQKILDLGILYFFIFGVAGAAGSFLSGLLLDFLFLIGIPVFTSFKILFAILILFAIIALAMQKKMKSLGSLPVKDALEVIFSFRDLRAINILDRLNKAEDSKEEELLLTALHDTPSHLAIDGLLERARSPRFATRLEAITALEKMERLNVNAKEALLNDVKNNQFTTAYISARILGHQNYNAGIPVLRELAVSNDYMLAGEAVIALARMKDDEFRPEIEKLIMEAKNPRLRIMCAEALGQYKRAESVSVLLDILRRDNPPPYLRGEVMLALASILDTQGQFYKILVRYKNDNSLFAILAVDEVEYISEFVKTTLKGKKNISEDKINLINSHTNSFLKAVQDYVNENNGENLSGWIFGIPEKYFHGDEIIRHVLMEAVLDDELSSQKSLRLLIVNWATRELRNWAVKLK